MLHHEKNLQVLIDNSDIAMISWNKLGFDERAAILLHWAQQLPMNIAAMVNFQCANALQYVAKLELMPGPTGETNELYCCGRGVFVVTALKGMTEVAIVGQLVAALVCGNAVLLCIADKKQAEKIKIQLEQLGCIAGVITVVNISDVDALVTHPQTAGVAYCGDLNGAQQLARQLAQREGVLAQLVAELDGEQVPVIGSQHYCLRFITERTRTINITAVGGNATLLELGCGE
ncbi:proline dehydrogenase [Photobacterium kishitanii]|uniref:Proline dehydrogenase n=1 Tax=Photobacterium kishitanii TaxID=318456 RepID=A0A2T3QT90_9GAMM|nr:aldehyde dehydrogenase family protein [Photobacterium kishitanii]KJG09400.1 proline dehydrogenase [Photobacterium kishitanii]KJG57398.1 proline dehydrogenase [Photobacterium kishitanii]KJG60875.1 proline dehydrogenase [Photobacterium kishitanii]KJG65149.1 proline dehydrogenase [Photobacterium kishitanii]KJG69293.1 proline dehydrogenase [Photobacterium kishitanii]